MITVKCIKDYWNNDVKFFSKDKLYEVSESFNSEMFILTSDYGYLYMLNDDEIDNHFMVEIERLCE